MVKSVKKIEQAVILAGGMGMRLRPFTDTAAKPMLPVNGKPFIAYLLEQIKQFGIDRVLILLGYMPDSVVSYIGDGKQFGLEVRYSVTDAEDETQKRIYSAKNMIDGDFLLLYCDNYCPLDFSKMEKQFYEGSAKIQITAYSNTDGYTKNNLLYSLDSFQILSYDKKRTENSLNAVDIGYGLIRRELLDMLDGENVNFEGNIYPKLVEQRELSAYVADHRYYSIGSWERIELTKLFFSGQKIAFVDRDGTLNKRPPKAQYIESPEGFIWLEGAKEAVKLLNKSDYKVFLITNQPGVARGFMRSSDLELIHKKMLCDLSDIGAHIDKIYCCTHGWNDGCGCRKPKPGMLFAAQHEFNFNMLDAVFFGDDERDMAAAAAAGCRGVFVDDEKGLLEGVREVLL